MGDLFIDWLPWINTKNSVSLGNVIKKMFHFSKIWIKTFFTNDPSFVQFCIATRAEFTGGDQGHVSAGLDNKPRHLIEAALSLWTFTCFWRRAQTRREWVLSKSRSKAFPESSCTGRITKQSIYRVSREDCAGVCVGWLCARLSLVRCFRPTFTLTCKLPLAVMPMQNV